MRLDPVQEITDAAIRAIGAALAVRSFDVTPTLDPRDVARAIACGQLTVVIRCLDARDGRADIPEALNSVALAVLVEGVTVAVIEDVARHTWIGYAEGISKCYH